MIKWNSQQNNSGINWNKSNTKTSALDSFGSLAKEKTVLGAGLEAGRESISNLTQSAMNFASGVKDIVSNPIDTLKTVGGIVGGAGSKILESTVGKGIEKITGQPIQKTDTQVFDNFTTALKQRYGSLEALQKTATEDPLGFGADVLSVLEGGAGLVGKTQQLNKGLSTVSNIVTKPISKTAGAISDVTSATTKFGISQATGLNPETISEVIKNPQKFKNINPELRVETAKQVKSALDTRAKELSETGKGYDVIRNSTDIVTIPENTIKTVLEKYGVKLDENNKIITSPESRPLSQTDKASLQNFIDNYGSEKVLSSNAFLNTREALSNLAKYEQGKTNLSTQISRDLRATYDDLGKTQIKGLKELDTEFAPEKQLISQIKKDIIAPDGTLKDGAISKIANITGKGKEKVLERIKQVVPDIEERVNLIKAVEDIERTSGIKVGTYTRAGAGLVGLSTGNIPIIIGAILAQPQIAVPLLKGAGYVGQKARPILETIKTIANDINNFKMPILPYGSGEVINN